MTFLKFLKSVKYVRKAKLLSLRFLILICFVKIVFIVSPGRGIGGLVTGKLFDPVSGIGEVWTFRLYGGLALVVLAVYGIINASVFSRPVFAPRRISIVITAEKSGMTL